MIDVKVISSNIRKYRKASSLTQAELAERLFVAPQTVSKWERGISIPSITDLSGISDILSVSVASLLEGASASEKEVMIAIDGGGTKTEFVLFSTDGKVKRTLLGGTNANVIGINATCEVLTKGISSLLEDNVKLVAIFCGIAGVGVGKNAATITAHLKNSYPHTKIRVESDVQNVIGLADDPDNCVAVIMGTGSSVFSSFGGKVRRFGGWGFIFDGAGSGYDIGREVIRRTLAVEDGIAETSLLVKACSKRIGSPVFSEVARLRELGVDHIASFSSIAFDAARKNDPYALEIIKKSIDRICDLIDHAMGQNKSAPVIISGGLCSSADIILPLMKEKLPDANISITKNPQILGAIRMCLTLTKTEASPELLFRIEQGYKECLL